MLRYGECVHNCNQGGKCDWYEVDVEGDVDEEDGKQREKLRLV